MQKRVVAIPAVQELASVDWLELQVLADVELTSENVAHSIEAALAPNGQAGWRAAEPGRQSIRLVFHSPQRLRRIRLRFDEVDAERTQEFALRWSPDRGRTFRDIVRQQYTFSPSGATREVEEFAVDLAGVTLLELTIIPDQQGRAYASLAEWRIG